MERRGKSGAEKLNLLVSEIYLLKNNSSHFLFLMRPIGEDDTHKISSLSNRIGSYSFFPMALFSS